MFTDGKASEKDLFKSVNLFVLIEITYIGKLKNKSEMLCNLRDLTMVKSAKVLKIH